MATSGNYLSSLFVRIGADTTGLEQGIARAKGQLTGLAPYAKTAAVALAAIGTAAAAAGAGMVALTASSAKAAREIGNMAQVSNTSATEFQALAFAARTVGIENEKFADILKDVNDRIGDFRSTGGGPMLDFFEQIAPKVGVTAESFRNLSGPQALQLYYDSLVKAGAAQEDLTFYMEAMASDATALIPLLENGGEGFRKMAEQAEALGIIMSDVERQNLVQFDYAINTISATIEGLKNRFAASLAPALTEVAGRFINFITELNRGKGAIDDVTDATTELGTSSVMKDWIYNVGLGLARLTDVLIGIGKTVSAVHGSFKTVLADLDTLNAGAVSAISNAFGTKNAEQKQKELEVMLAKRNKTLEEANAKWADLWKYEGNRFEQAWMKAFEGPVELPAITVNEGTGRRGLNQFNEGDEDDSAKKEREARLKQLQDRLEMLRETVASETEIEIKGYLDRQEQLREIYAEGLVSDTEMMELTQDLEQQHQDKLTEIAEKAAKDRVKTAQKERQDRVDAMDQMFGNLVSLMNTGNRTMFNIGKVAAIAQATVKGYQAVVDSYQFGASIGGPPLGAAMAATAGIATAAQIAQIASVQFGGGGSTASSGYSQPTDALPNGTGAGGGTGAAAAPERGIVTINLQGNVFDQKSVRELITQINEAVGDGARLRVG